MHRMSCTRTLQATTTTVNDARPRQIYNIWCTYNVQANKAKGNSRKAWTWGMTMPQEGHWIVPATRKFPNFTDFSRDSPRGTIDWLNESWCTHQWNCVTSDKTPFWLVRTSCLDQSHAYNTYPGLIQW